MNFLEIVKKTNIFSGLQGDIDSVVGVTGLQATLVEFVNAAYLDIQLLRDNWKWMQRYSSTFAWTPDATSRVISGINKYLTIYNTSGETLTYVPYIDWVTSKASSATPVDSPSQWTVEPETNALVLSPVKASVLLSYVAVLNPETLTTNLQIPKMPERYHFTVVYKAAMDMGYFLGNAEVGGGNAARYDMLLSQLLRNQNDSIVVRQRPLV